MIFLMQNISLWYFLLASKPSAELCKSGLGLSWEADFLPVWCISNALKQQPCEKLHTMLYLGPFLFLSSSSIPQSGLQAGGLKRPHMKNKHNNLASSAFADGVKNGLSKAWNVLSCSTQTSAIDISLSLLMVIYLKEFRDVECPNKIVHLK